MEEQIRAHLIAAETSAAGRWEWLQRPQGSGLPAGTLQVVSGRRTQTLTGPDGLVESIVQIDCWGATYEQAKTLARQAIAALATLTGDPFRSALMVEAEADSFEPGDGVRSDDTTDFYRTRLDVRVWRTET